jgi:hydrogenase nickel incorporation protein HypA/HybF
MHELPVVLDIIRVMDEEAKKNSIQRIKQINLVIGELSSVINESVQMYFEIAAKGTPCEGSELVFEHRPAMLKCEGCGNEFPHKKDFQCPLCGKDSVLIKGTGREFYIRSFDGQ